MKVEEVFEHYRQEFVELAQRTLGAKWAYVAYHSDFNSSLVLDISISRFPDFEIATIGYVARSPVVLAYGLQQIGLDFKLYAPYHTVDWHPFIIFKERNPRIALNISPNGVLMDLRAVHEDIITPDLVEPYLEKVREALIDLKKPETKQFFETKEGLAKEAIHKAGLNESATKDVKIAMNLAIWEGFVGLDRTAIVENVNRSQMLELQLNPQSDQDFIARFHYYIEQIRPIFKDLSNEP